MLVGIAPLGDCERLGSLYGSFRNILQSNPMQDVLRHFAKSDRQLLPMSLTGSNTHPK